MEKLIKAGKDTIEKFYKHNYRQRYGIGIPYSFDEFLDDYGDDIEQGVLPDKDNTVALITNPDTEKAQDFLSLFNGFEPVNVDWDKDMVEQMASTTKSIDLGFNTYNLHAILEVFQIIGWKVRYYALPKDVNRVCQDCGRPLAYCEKCQAYHHQEEFDLEHGEPIRLNEEGTQLDEKTFVSWLQPALFVNHYKEGIVLAPMKRYGDKHYSYDEWMLAGIDKVDEMLEAINNPDIVRVELDDNQYNLHREDIEALSLTNIYRQPRHEVILTEEASERLGLISRNQKLSKIDLQKIQEKFALEIRDDREEHEFNAEVLKNKVFSAWQKRDPTFQEPELYQRCLDHIFEMAKYGYAIPSDLEFYVSVYPQEPPERMDRYHHSLYTLDEWFRAITTRIGGCTRLQWEFRSPSRYTSYEEPIFILKVQGKLNKCDEILHKLPDLDIQFCDYKAKHLLHYISNVDVSGSGWFGWQNRLNVEMFEREAVEA